VPIDHATDNDHGQNEAGTAQLASGNRCFSVWMAPCGRSSLE
jgi:hypothetical protein